MEELKSQRLIIRKFKETDWEDLYEYFSDEEVLKFDLINLFQWKNVKKKL